MNSVLALSFRTSSKQPSYEFVMFQNMLNIDNNPAYHFTKIAAFCKTFKFV